MSVFCPSNLRFRQNQPMKFEILTFLPARRNFIIFVQAELKTPIQILLKISVAHRLVFSKRYIGSTKNYSRGFILSHWKAHRKFGVKLTPDFQFSPEKNSLNFVPASQEVKISNFMGLFCLKGTLVQLKTVAGVSCCDTEGPWKV